MISFGKNITAVNDSLMKIEIEKIYHAIKSPKPETVANIRRLRTVKELDPKQYSILKRQLPYIVCAIFNPPYRKIDNFAYTQYFIIDIDKISEKQLSIETLKNSLIKDETVFMVFVSPSENGLKVIFKLKERCYDAGLYSIFYKTFVKKFSAQYNIEQVIDKQTSDVSRACFVSIDPNVYYNPNAIHIELSAYLDLENPHSLFETKRLQEKEEKQVEIPKVEKVDIDDDAFRKIKAILNPNLKQILSKPPVFVPEELENTMVGLITYLQEANVIVDKIVNISFGKKLQMRVENKLAEINLFYGKKGFSVVISPRSGTSEGLNKLMFDLIQQYIFTEYYQ